MPQMCFGGVAGGRFISIERPEPELLELELLPLFGDGGFMLTSRISARARASW